jgi:hypothetical protein
MIAFWLGFLIFGVGALYLTIYVHQVDPKFREAPDLEFKVELAGVGLDSAMAIIGMMFGFPVAKRMGWRAVRERHWTHSLLAGVLAPPIVDLGSRVLRPWLHSFADNISYSALLALPAVYCIFWIKGPANPPAGDALDTIEPTRDSAP